MQAGAAMRPPLNSIAVSVLLLLVCPGCGPKSSSRAPEVDESKGPSIVFQQEGGRYYSETCHYHLEYPLGVWINVHNSDRRPGGCGPLDDVERRHHRRGDSLHRSVRVAGHEPVHGLGAPGNADVLLDPLDDLASGRRCIRKYEASGR